MPARTLAPAPGRDTAWTPATRIAFRFLFCYFSLYVVAGPMLGGLLILPDHQIPALGDRWPMGVINAWTARTLFGVDAPFQPGNSGDTLFHWVQTCWTMAAAISATAIWSAVDRRTQYVRLHVWFRLFIRFALAAQMFFFGFAKVVPTQFVPPALTTLVQDVGTMSLSILLWVFVGSSTPYQIFTGVAEVAAAVLLLTPRTALLGAMICLLDMIHVLVLNAAYDFGLKQIAVHYIAMAVFLIAPDLQRLANVFVLNRAAQPAHEPALFRRAAMNRAALMAQMVFGLYLASVFIWVQVRQWDAADGPAHPRSLLYGIWDIETLEVDGQVRHAELNDYDRQWRRAVFDFPDRMAFQRTDDSLARYGTAIDPARRTLTLTKGRTGVYAFTYDRPSEDRLLLDGRMDEHAVRITLTRVGLDTFPLLNSTFRWVRPPD